MRYRKLTTATRSGTRLEQLRTLAKELAASIDKAASDPDQVKQLAPLAKQYRETIREIEDIEGADTSGDAIGEILASRVADGKPGAVRKDRTGLRKQ